MPSMFPAHVAYGHDQSIVEEYVPGTGSNEPFVYGDFVVLSSTKAIRCGADPAAILGLSEVNSEQAKLITPNGKVPVRTLSSEIVLAMASATDFVETTHLNVAYGITRDGTTGFWRVDVAKTGGDARVTVVRGDPVTNTWFVKVLASVLTNDGIVS